MNLASISILSALVLAGSVLPDKCKPNAETGLSEDGLIRVVPTIEWTFQWQKRTAKDDFETVHQGDLQKVGHPHLYTHVFNSGVFVIVNPGGGHETGNRVVFYKPEGDVLKAIGLADFLSPDELKDLQPSKSHIHWMAVKGEGYEMGISEKDGLFWLKTKWKKTHRFDGKTGELRKDDADKDGK